MTHDDLSESAIETFALDLLQSLGWDYVFGPDINPDIENNILQIINLRKRLNKLYLES